MPQSWKDSFVELFRFLPGFSIESFRKNPDISFIWKFEEELQLSENVLRTQWIPQNDLLALNKTAAFITHGGYNSLGEAVQSGTPCVFVPLFADQFRNSMLAQYRQVPFGNPQNTREFSRGIGIQQPKFELTFESLNAKLHEILNNPRWPFYPFTQTKIIQIFGKSPNVSVAPQGPTELARPGASPLDTTSPQPPGARPLPPPAVLLPTL